MPRGLAFLVDRLRFFRRRVRLWRLWRASRRGRGVPFFAALEGYALSTFAHLRRRHPATNLDFEYVPIADDARLDPPRPETLAGNPLARMSAPFSSCLFAARVRNVCVYGEPGDVVTQDGVLLADCSFRVPVDLWYEQSEHLLLQGNPLPRAKPLRGTHALLTSAHGGANYFHWLFDVLPRVALLERANIPTKELGFLCNRMRFDVQHETLRVLGIAPERIVEMGYDSALQVESLWVMSSLLTTGHRRRWICDWLRSRFLPSNAVAKPTRRLFLSREDAASRRLANEEEVLGVLAPLGFEKVVIGRRSIFEQSDLFAQAEIVVAPHTTALGNILFCVPGTRVIDLMPADRLRTYMAELSATMRLDYYYAFAAWLDPHVRPDGAENDTVIPLDTLRAILRKARVT